jgi:hypothetical protein
MPKATKIVVHFDDGSTYTIPVNGTGSIFLNEGKAVKCGHKPPYGKPPKNGTAEATGDTATLSLMSTESTTSATSDTTDTSDDAQLMEGSCYVINGVVVCP